VTGDFQPRPLLLVVTVAGGQEMIKDISWNVLLSGACCLLSGLQPDASENLAGLEVDDGNLGASWRIQMESKAIAIEGQRGDGRIFGDRNL